MKQTRILLTVTSLTLLNFAFACGKSEGSLPQGAGSGAALQSSGGSGSGSGSAGSGAAAAGGAAQAGDGAGGGDGDGGTPGGETGGASGGGTAGGGGTIGSGGEAALGSGGAPEGGGGESSEDAAAAQMGSIEFSPLATSFQGSIEVTLSTAETGDIHFTVDGTAPTSASPTYSAAISMAATTQIRAVVLAADAPVGEPGSAVYLALGAEITSDIPIVVLDNYVGGAVVEQGGGERPFVDGTFMSFAVKDGVASLADTPDVATRAAFHVRGQSSAAFDKTPYRLELRNNEDADHKFPLLGMPSQSDWILRGPYADKALIRDAFFYSLGADMGMAAPKFQLVEFYLNTDNESVDAGDYMGVYLIAETIKNSKNRLDLVQLDEEDTELPDITGGYIFKFEWFAGEEPLISCSASTNCWGDLEVYDPLPLNAPQKEWLSAHIHEFHEALYGADWLDAAAGYASYIDVDSFVDQMIVNEIGREMDSYARSAYFHKDRDGVIVAGPLWDYNLSFGVGGFFDNQNLEGWMYVQNSSTGPDVVQNRTPGNEWFFRLMEDPAFVQKVKDRWQALRAGMGVLSDQALDDRVSALSDPIANAATRNFERWDMLGTSAIQATPVAFDTPVTTTWEEQITFLRTWMHDRVAWLDTQWGP